MKKKQRKFLSNTSSRWLFLCLSTFPSLQAFSPDDLLHRIDQTSALRQELSPTSSNLSPYWEYQTVALTPPSPYSSLVLFALPHMLQSFKFSQDEIPSLQNPQHISHQNPRRRFIFSAYAAPHVPYSLLKADKIIDNMPSSLQEATLLPFKVIYPALIPSLSKETYLPLFTHHAGDLPQELLDTYFTPLIGNKRIETKNKHFIDFTQTLSLKSVIHKDPSYSTPQSLLTNLQLPNEISPSCKNISLLLQQIPYASSIQFASNSAMLLSSIYQDAHILSEKKTHSHLKPSLLPPAFVQPSTMVQTEPPLRDVLQPSSEQALLFSTPFSILSFPACYASPTKEQIFVMHVCIPPFSYLSTHLTIAPPHITPNLIHDFALPSMSYKSISQDPSLLGHYAPLQELSLYEPFYFYVFSYLKLCPHLYDTSLNFKYPPDYTEIAVLAPPEVVNTTAHLIPGMESSNLLMEALVVDIPVLSMFSVDHSTHALPPLQEVFSSQTDALFQLTQDLYTTPSKESSVPSFKYIAGLEEFFTYGTIDLSKKMETFPKSLTNSLLCTSLDHTHEPLIFAMQDDIYKYPMTLPSQEIASTFSIYDPFFIANFHNTTISSDLNFNMYSYLDTLAAFLLHTPFEDSSLAKENLCESKMLALSRAFNILESFFTLNSRSTQDPIIAKITSIPTIAAVEAPALTIEHSPDSVSVAESTLLTTTVIFKDLSGHSPCAYQDFSNFPLDKQELSANKALLSPEDLVTRSRPQPHLLSDTMPASASFHPDEESFNGLYVKNDSNFSQRIDSLALDTTPLLTSSLPATFGKSNPIPPLIPTKADLKPSRQKAYELNQVTRQLPKEVIPSLEQLQTMSLTEEFNVNIEVIPNTKEKQGYLFAITLEPIKHHTITRAAQNFLFLMDRSAAIDKNKFQVFKQAITKSLPYLQEGDTFNIITFDGEISRMSHNNVFANASSKLAARRFLESQKRGFKYVLPNIYDILLQAHGIAKNSELPTTVILLTNGKTLESFNIYNDRLSQLVSANKSDFSLFTACSSHNNNTLMLEVLSSLNKGELMHSETNAAFPRKLAAFVKHAGLLVANNVHINAATTDTSLDVEFFPNTALAPNLYSDRPYTIIGKIDKLADFDLVLQGRFCHNWINITKKISFKEAKNGSYAIYKNYSTHMAYQHYREFLKEGNTAYLNQAKKVLQPFNTTLPN